MQRKGESQTADRFSHNGAVRIPFSIPPRGARPFDVVGFGLNSVDLIAVVPEHPAPDSKSPLRSLTRLPGGQAATAMVTCARLGLTTRYIGRFGDDDAGTFGRASLVSEGVDVTAASIAKGATNQIAIILVDAQTAQRTVLWQRHPGLAMTPADVDESVVASGRVLLVDCHETAAAARAAALARASGALTVVDVEKVRPAIHDLLREIDVIIASESFPAALTGRSATGAALRALAAEFPAPVICVTLGADGSLALCGGREIRTPGFKVAAVDTTGAGDVFRGGFIAGAIAGGPGGDLTDVLRYANAVAALKCRRLGARDGIPRPREVVELLAAQPSA
jgi:sugar/nucleoside kinase (ribokinase family)